MDTPGIRGRVTDHLAVAAGTTKGLFIVSDGIADGPFFKGNAVPSFLKLDGRLLAGIVDPFFGPSVRMSDDGGATWSETTERSIAFPEDTGAAVAQIWQLQPDRGASGDVILAGVEPAALFRSTDGGVTFELVRGLWDHPDRLTWEPGAGGLGLHTILTHPDRPDRIIVAISAGGVYRSDDDGETWAAKNKGIEASFLPEPFPESGQCVHKMAFDASSPDILWAQNHGGIYRSADAGEEWVSVGQPGEATGVAADFGFPIVGHPVQGDTAYVFPLESAMFRCSPEGQCRVYRTTDGGIKWRALAEGLPGSYAHVTVLRDAFTVGDDAPYPFVFGTRSGDIYASVDNGDNWRLFASDLPPVLCVRVLG